MDQCEQNTNTEILDKKLEEFGLEKDGIYLFVNGIWDEKISRKVYLVQLNSACFDDNKYVILHFKTLFRSKVDGTLQVSEEEVAYPLGLIKINEVYPVPQRNI